jgi:hypothetical protein
VRGNGRQEQFIADLLAASWQMREAVHYALTNQDSPHTRRILDRALEAAGGLPDAPYTTIAGPSDEGIDTNKTPDDARK